MDATQQNLFTRIQFQGNAGDLLRKLSTRSEHSFGKDSGKYWVLVAIIEKGYRVDHEWIVHGKSIVNYHTKMYTWRQRFQELAKEGIIEYELKDRNRSVYIIKNIGKIVKLIADMGDYKSIRFNKLKELYLPQIKDKKIVGYEFHELD